MPRTRIPIFFLFIFTLLALGSSPLVLAEEQVATGFAAAVDAQFGVLVGYLYAVTFVDVLFFTEAYTLPLAVAWLVVGALFFTFRMGFINIRAFRHAIACVRGKYSNPDDPGETSHFQALTTALSATVGLGNIAGVAIAISIGGPGATFWMIVAGFLGMTAKFTECTLGQMYREVRPDGRIMGGAMEYLSRGLAEKGWARTGKVLAIVFCILCIGASFGAGNAFQVSQSFGAVKQAFPVVADYSWAYGLIMLVLVGAVIIGGIKRIAQLTQSIVPTMCGLYVLACLWIILMHIGDVPQAFGTIITGAFSPEAGLGGIIGVLIVGFQRAAFSNEAGIGSAAIAHATAKTKHPVREGIVALLEPFIDTVVICTMTALVIIITGVYNSPETADLVTNREGAALTGVAFSTVISWFPIFLSISVVLFAYSTMIAWSYYGERCWSYLFGDGSATIYRILFLVFIFLGAITSATNVLDFSDLMLLAMAFPNLIGLYFLHGKVRESLRDYMLRLKSGEFEKESQN
ncbi:Na(+)-linked D-alanine glycine permease [hydrothermal vent metagenome]|uniref:Na(+)-linked D-alanine glycine permease n=1 Tax=hydrothermal vent metagenome TaxID=652676 RepID=A0A3B0ZPZ0_9ZZZZ